jgi:hypothetical protein
MPTFITIGYGDEAGYHQLSGDHRRAAHARDDELSASGALVGRAGDPVQVRNPDGAGVSIERVSHTPCAVAHGVVEVWPLQP